MKKVLVICMAVIMAAGMTLTAFADNGGFVESPSLNPAPRIRSVVRGSDDCQAEIIITPYSQRDTLDAEDKKALEDAYTDIKTTNDVSTLNVDLDKLASSLNVGDKNLAVSDLFDMDYINCNHEEHLKHGYFTIELEADTLRNFVGLLHCNDGEWELVSDAKAEGNLLTFKIDDFSPFAIVVDTNPETGDNYMIYVWGIIASVSAFAVVVCFKKSGKEQAE